MPDRPLPCPQCGGDSAVRDSRPTVENWIRRRRACSKCNHRFSTIELPVEILDSYADVATSKDITLLIRLLDQARDLATKIRDLPPLPADYDRVNRERDK